MGVMEGGPGGWRVADPRDPPCKCWCGGVLLSHTLPGAVPSPCRALASRFGMGLGVSPGPWPPQDLFLLCPPPPWAGCGSRGSGTGQGRERALASLGSSIARDPR